MSLPIEAAARTARDSGLEPGATNRTRRVPRVMGIVNVTPDSFSDGGVHFDSGYAVEAALRMEAEGAAFIDVGGESTRPGSETVPAGEELRRVIPVIREIRRQSRILISVDTRKSEVAEAALEAGASMVNDVTALAGDSRMAAIVRDAAASVILMHMRGEPKTMQEEIHFDDLIGELSAELRERRDAAIAAGISPERILVDPGIGFGKTFDHNLEILARLHELVPIAPLVVGASRKAFIGHLTGKASGPDRMAGSLATVAAAASAGAAIVRVHDVAETSDFLRVLGAVEERRR
ncbi:MAG TPA: dihydropteroate synthase [Thermoanaerobaculia bacterium]|nr:dihydropteroate synthase [Thermoanaerobaculia bacterium]